MDRTSLHNQLHVLNETELFYKEYYEAKQAPESLAQFLAKMNLDRTDLDTEENVPLEYGEKWYFNSSTKNHSIYVLKHNCYTPDNLHKHGFFELFYVLEGSCSHEICGARQTLHTGDLCLIQPGVMHRISVYDESIIVNILISRTTFEDFFFNILRGDNTLSQFFWGGIYSKNAYDYIIFHTGSDDEFKDSILDIYVEFINKDTYYEILLNSMVTALFTKLLRRYEKTCELPSTLKKYDSQSFLLIQYIKDNFESITLGEVAEKFHYTPEYTSKLIKEITGYTFTQILTSARMIRSKSMLRDTNFAIGDITQQVGYLNPEHFIRTFKKFVGTTPSNYRKNYSEYE